MAPFAWSVLGILVVATCGTWVTLRLRSPAQNQWVRYLESSRPYVSGGAANWVGYLILFVFAVLASIAVGLIAAAAGL